MRKVVLAVFSALFLTCFIVTNHAFCKEGKIRRPAVAGAFYPASAEDIKGMINKYLSAAEDLPDINDPRVIMVPHAGYVYSGPVAVYGFKLLEGRHFDTVILMGPSHTARYPGVSIFPRGGYETPLGVVPINEEMASKLIQSNDRFFFYDVAHVREHSLEVEIPFLQTVLKDFKIVPVLMGTDDYQTCAALAESIQKVTQGKNVLVLVSTDLSHYHKYDKACAMDKGTIDEIAKLDSKAFYEFVAAGKGEACGHAAITTALILAELEGWDKAEVLKYANSGDTAGDKSRVVGYASIVIYGGGGGKMNPADEKEQVVSKKGKKKLLEIARQTLEDVLSGKKPPTFSIKEADLNQKAGAFVTLHEHGALRGCIGNFFPGGKPLYETIQDMAVAAALNDPRFQPVKADELKDIDIEISVLSPMKRVAGADEVTLGKHGVYLKKGFRSGTFLPQVATETDWTKEEFLGHLARDKAGLGWDGWKDAEIYVYTAEVFGEKKHGNHNQ